MRENRVFHILVINPGSTSTKISYFEDDRELESESCMHSTEDLKGFERVCEQVDYRARFVQQFLEQRGIETEKLDAVSARGGLLKPVESGVYRVNQYMLDDLLSARYGEHASNLGALIASKIARNACCPAYIADPVAVDEMEEVARVTGLPEIERKSIFHALSQKSVGREIANRIGRAYEDCNFIVAHMGGGISVGAHRKGKVVDVNNALDGDGPFSPERSGGLPAGQLVRLCAEGIFSKDEIFRKLTGEGGLVAHRGSNSFSDLRKDADGGDEHAKLLYDSLAYKVSQEICKHGATLCGEVDRIILTGGMAKDFQFIEQIRERVRYLAQVEVIPGEREMQSLALAALGVLRRKIKEKEYL